MKISIKSTLIMELTPEEAKMQEMIIDHYQQSVQSQGSVAPKFEEFTRDMKMNLQQFNQKIRITDREG